MPFGKHRGTKLAELDDDYLGWLSTRDLRDPLRSAVEVEIRRRGGRPPSKPEPAPTGDDAQVERDRKIAIRIVDAGVRCLHVDGEASGVASAELDRIAGRLRSTIKGGGR